MANLVPLIQPGENNGNWKGCGGGFRLTAGANVIQR
jgi:hypothetical protein